MVGSYVILEDFANGVFPPKFDDQQQAYENEIAYGTALPGLTQESMELSEMTKPYWFGPAAHRYLQGFLKLVSLLEDAPLTPPAKLLELGGGSGWTAEMLATMGFRVTSTTLSPRECAIGKRRIAALRAKGLTAELDFLACPMESVAAHVADLCPFDGVFVFEALHHAFDWRATLNSSFSCLRPGGWLIICNEPNVLHTAISYRVAKLAKTHEVGFAKSALIKQLRATGFRKIVSAGRRPDLYVQPHWLMAQR
jgi:cyclopropane fatty-acyl-phospholipid synthase-like methyltransferase